MSDAVLPDLLSALSQSLAAQAQVQAAQLETLQRIEAAVAAATRKRYPKFDIPTLVRCAWVLKGESTWEVGELRDVGLVAPAVAVEVGKALGRLAKDGGRVDELLLERVIQNGRLGNVWKLTPVSEPPPRL